MIFVFIIFLKQIFWEQEILGVTAPECAPVATGPTVFDLFSEAAHSFFCRMFCFGIVKNVN